MNMEWLEEVNQSHRYEPYAEATGGHGERVSTRDELVPALKRALAVVRKGEPALLDVATQPR